jgi:hypothetical protein
MLNLEERLSVDRHRLRLHDWLKVRLGLLTNGEVAIARVEQVWFLFQNLVLHFFLATSFFRRTRYF